MMCHKQSKFVSISIADAYIRHLRHLSAFSKSLIGELNSFGLLHFAVQWKFGNFTWRGSALISQTFQDFSLPFKGQNNFLFFFSPVALLLMCLPNVEQRIGPQTLNITDRRWIPIFAQSPRLRVGRLLSVCCKISWNVFKVFSLSKKEAKLWIFLLSPLKRNKTNYNEWSGK